MHEQHQNMCRMSISAAAHLPQLEHWVPVKMAIGSLCSRQAGSAAQAQRLIMFTADIKILCVFLFCSCIHRAAAEAEQQAWLVLNGEIGRPDGLWLEMRGLRQDGLEVFILMESIRCKCQLHPALMGSFHCTGRARWLFSVSALLCLVWLTLSHLYVNQLLLVVCCLSVCQLVCQPVYEFIWASVGVHSREMYMCVTASMFWLSSLTEGLVRKHLSWASVSDSVSQLLSAL